MPRKGQVPQYTWQETLPAYTSEASLEELDLSTVSEQTFV